MNEWCHEFVDRNYRPQVDDLQCLFRPEPAESFSIEEAAGRVASESSVRTWTEVTTIRPRIRRLIAKAYQIEGNFVKIAYPIQLFEQGNMPEVLSSIAA